MTTDTPAAAHTLDWSTVAEGWWAHRDHVEAMKTELTRRLLDALALQTGERVLELGGGAGPLARRLSEAVGETGTVVATDVASGMVELIRASTADLANVEAAQVDAADIDAADASFDAVIFRMGLMLLPEPERGLREIRRVLTTGGRAAIATWAGIEHNPWLTTVGMTGMLTGVLNGPLPTGPGGPLSLGDPDHLAALARDAGFADADVSSLDVVFDAADVDAHLAHVTSLAPPLKAAYGAASDEQRAAWRSALEQATQQFRTDAGLRIPGKALLLLARV
jgi:SAM-dependent methyltransferase